ncbi:putative myb dna-binding domain containing protein, partial [Golovinomyces cichoracearum]
NQQQSNQPKLKLSEQRHQQTQSQLQLQNNLPVQQQPQAQMQRYHSQSQEPQQKLPQQRHQPQHHQLSQPLSQQRQQNQQLRSQSQPHAQSNLQQHQKLLQQRQDQSQQKQKLHQKQQSVLRPDYASEHEHPYELKVIQREAKQSVAHHDQKIIMQKENNAQSESQLFSMKQENISPKLERGGFVSSRMLRLSGQSTGNEVSNMTPNSAELRHSLQSHQIHNLQSRLNHTLPQSLLNENSGVEREVKSISTQNTTGGIATPCEAQERYIASQPAVSTNFRQPEVVRKMSNIMSLLNNDEPSETRPSPHGQISDNQSSTHSSQTFSSYPLPSVSRYPPKDTQATFQHPASIPHKLSQVSIQSDVQHKNLYSHRNSQQAPPNSSSIGKHPRSYTLAPSKFENHGYPPSSMQSQQQKMYQQSSQCQSINNQSPASIDRDISRNEIHVITGSYSGRPVTSNQSSASRLKESPYSVTSPSSMNCQSGSATSPIDTGNTDQDYYGHQYQIQCASSSSHDNSLPQNVQQQILAGTNNSSSTTHFNRTVLQNQHSYQNPQHPQPTHSLGQPQSQKQERNSKSRSVEQMQIPFGHPSHISGNGNRNTSQLAQYPAQILPTSHSQLSPQKNHSSPVKVSTNRRSKREIFDGRYNNQLPPSSTGQNSSQQELSYAMPLQNSVSGTYSVQNHPSSHGNSLGPHHTVQHGDMNGNYIQYERQMREDEYHHARVRGYEERDRERIR